MKDSSYLDEAGFDNISIQQCVSAFMTSNKPIECQLNSKELMKPIQLASTHFTERPKPYVFFQAGVTFFQ